MGDQDRDTGPFDLDAELGDLDLDADDVVAFDLDGDGLVDLAMVDLDGDGAFDTVVVDVDGDGVMDALWIDVDGDGTADAHVGPFAIGDDPAWDAVAGDGVGGMDVVVVWADPWGWGFDVPGGFGCGPEFAAPVLDLTGPCAPFHDAASADLLPPGFDGAWMGGWDGAAAPDVAFGTADPFDLAVPYGTGVDDPFAAAAYGDPSAAGSYEDGGGVFGDVGYGAGDAFGGDTYAADPSPEPMFDLYAATNELSMADYLAGDQVGAGLWGDASWAAWHGDAAGAYEATYDAAFQDSWQSYSEALDLYGSGDWAAGDAAYADSQTMGWAASDAYDAWGAAEAAEW